MDTPDKEKSGDLYHQARALIELNRLDEAVTILEESSRIFPHFKTLELQGECLSKLGRKLEAIIPLAAAVGLNKGVRAASLLAEVFLSLGDTDKARDAAEEALRRDPNNRKARRASSNRFSQGLIYKNPDERHTSY